MSCSLSRTTRSSRDSSGRRRSLEKLWDCLLWPEGSEVKTYSPILHESEAGAEVSQADVAVHIQQNVVGLNVPEITKEKETRVSGGRGPEEEDLQMSSNQNSWWDISDTHSSVLISCFSHLWSILFQCISIKWRNSPRVIHLYISVD